MIQMLRETPAFGVGFGIELLKKDSLIRGHHRGKKGKSDPLISEQELFDCYDEITRMVYETALKNKWLEQIEKILKEYRRLGEDILLEMAKRFDAAQFSSTALRPINYWLITEDLTAADSVIIPVQCEYFALEGISKLLNTIKIIKTKLNPSLEIEGFLLTMFDSRLRLANQIYDEVKRHFQELVFKTIIQRNVKLSEAPSHGIPAILYDAESTGAKNHLALANEIITRNSK